MAKGKKKASRRASGTGQIYKDGDQYRASLEVGVDPRTGKKKYRSVRTRTHAEAVDSLLKMQAQYASGHLTTASGKSLSAYLESWLENKIKPNRAPSTYRQYQWIVNNHIVPLLGSKTIDKVSRQDVQRLLTLKSKQQVQSRSSKTSKPQATGKFLGRDVLRLIRAVLSSVYADAIKDGLTARNPAEYADLPRAKRLEQVFLNPTEASKLIATSRDTELGLMFELMITTGVRIGEATGIRWQDMDLNRKMVHIRGQLQRIEKKLAYRPTTKTNQDRYVPLTEAMVGKLKSLRATRMVDGTKPDPDGIVFLNREGRKIDPKYANDRLKNECRRAEVRVVSAHKLRHTAATLALSATGDLHAVQKLLGHQQVALTSDLYGHATAETLRTTTKAIEKALRSVAKKR